MGKRLDYVDILKGIGIILVVLGHRDVSFNLHKYIFSFHMPLFFFISGFLYNEGKYKTIKNLVYSKFTTILIPYLFFWTVSIPFTILYRKSSLLSSFLVMNTKGNTSWNTPLWFLPCLFFVFVIYYLTNKIAKNIWTRSLVIFLVFIIGYCLSIFKIKLPLGIDIACIGVLFFHFGSVVKPYILNGFNSRKIYICVPILFLISIALGLKLNVDVNLLGMYYGNIIYFLISAISSIIIYLIISMSIKSKVISFLGKNSITILCCHYFAFFIIDMFLRRIFNSGHIPQSDILSIGVTIITFFVLTPVIYVLNNYFPRLIGKA